MNNHSINLTDKKDYYFDHTRLFLVLLLTFSLCFSIPSRASLLEPTDLIDSSDKSSSFEAEVPVTEMDSLILQEFELSSLFDGPDNNQAITLARKGINRIKSGDTDGGLADLTKAWEINPSLSAAGVAIAVTYLKLSDYQKAYEASKKIQKSHPEFPAGYTLEGMSHVAMKQHDKAKTVFKKAYSLQPGNLNSGLNLAVYAIKDKQYDKARKLYQQILKHNPDSTHTAVLLSKLELKLNNPQQAKVILEKALLNHPESTKTRDLLMRLHFTIGEYQKVLDLSQEISSKDILAQPSLLEFRGKAQMLMGDIPSAIKTFEQLLTVLPDSAPAHFMLAKAYYQNKNLQQALHEIQQTIQLNTGYLPARIEEIKTLQLLGKTEQAKQRLIILQNEFKDNSDVISTAGWLAMQQGHYPEATKQFEMLAKQTPNSNATHLLFMSLLAQKRFDESIKVLETWLEQYPNDAPILSLLADSYLGLNRKEDAIAAYYRLIELAPNFAQAYNNLAFLLQEQNLQKAIMLAEKAQQLEQNNAHIKDTLGTLLIKGAQLKKGTLILKEAAQLAPENLEIQYHYAQALLKQGNSDHAQSILRKIIKKSPTSPAAIEAKKILSSLH